jgi:hypothetical protein
VTRDDFEIGWSRHALSTIVAYTGFLWRWLGRLETEVLRDELDAVDIESPIYVSGLARSGSTILLRVLESHPEVVTHQYRDFPFLHIPYWWQQTLEQQSAGELEPAERAHGDRLEVTRRSPEAMEEVLWMAYFSGLHDASTSNVLDAETTNDAFEDVYRDHLRKLLVARGGSRYASKANYNLTRLEYLLELFDEPRFVVPVRRPVAHVASSLKQHHLFCERLEPGDRGIEHLKRVGHYEFGPHRQPIHTGDETEIEAILEDWEHGRDVRGWARYWSHVYGWVADRMDDHDALRRATRIVRYEDLCDETRPTLVDMLEHCGLGEAAERIADSFEEAISRPNYYEHGFSDEELSIIAEETDGVARRFGYDDGDAVGEPSWRPT